MGQSEKGSGRSEKPQAERQGWTVREARARLGVEARLEVALLHQTQSCQM